MILNQPAVDEAAVTLPPHVLALKERNERALQSRQPVERNTREVMMLEMVVRVEECEVPEPVPLHQGPPLRRIRGIDVVVLAKAVQRKGNGKHEKDGDDARAKRGVEAEEIPQSGERHQMRCNRNLPLPANALLELRRICRGFAPSGPEVNREQRRRAVEQLVPAFIHLGREVVTLRIVFVRAKLGMVIQVPSWKLTRRDPARDRVQQGQDSL